MEIGISWDAFGEGLLPPEQQAEFLLQNNFCHTFLMAENPQINTLVPMLRRMGITVDNCHGPFRGINEIWSHETGENKILTRLLRSAETCAKHHIPVMVVHLSSGDDAPGINDAGTERFRLLVQRAGELGVTVAFENQRKLANLAYAMEEYPAAGFCWDAGHEQCFAHGREYMPLFGDRLVALHLHDNFKEHNRDLHMLPFDGGIDFNPVAMHIARTPYNGTVMLEAHRSTSGAYNCITPAQYYSRAAHAATRLRDMIAEKRRQIIPEQKGSSSL